MQFMDPFAHNFPAKISEQLFHPQHSEMTTTLSFNRRGTLLASGARDGKCCIWDMLTNGISTVLDGHIRSITSISWTRRGDQLLTSSRDWTCILWDLHSSTMKHKIHFSSAILEAQMYPRNKLLFAVIATGDSPTLLEFIHDKWERTFLDISSDGETSLASALCFTPDGKSIAIGTTHGTIFLFDLETRSIIYELNCPSSIRQIHFSSSSRYMIVNAMDRVIRCYQYDPSFTSVLGLLHSFKDAVEKVIWVQCAISADEEFVIGGII